MRRNTFILLQVFGKSYMVIRRYSLHMFMVDWGDFIRRALLIKKEALGEDNTDVATSLYMLGCLCQKMKRTKEATEYLEKALQIRREILGDNHPKTLEAAKELASI